MQTLPTHLGPKAEPNQRCWVDRAVDREEGSHPLRESCPFSIPCEPSYSCLGDNRCSRWSFNEEFEVGRNFDRCVEGRIREEYGEKATDEGSDIVVEREHRQAIEESCKSEVGVALMDAKTECETLESVAPCPAGMSDDEFRSASVARGARIPKQCIQCRF